MDPRQRLPDEFAMNFRFKDRRDLYLVFAIAAASVVAAFTLPPVQDFKEYLLQWQQAMAGANPWLCPDGTWNGNAYGPLHLLLAPAAALSPTLPRLVYSLCWPVIAALLLRAPLAQFSTERRALVLFGILAPFLWIEALIFAHMDVLIAALSLASVVLLAGEWSLMAGVLLGMATAIKLYPLALLPFMAIRHRRPDLRFVAAFSVAAILPFVVAGIIWGPSAFLPFRIAVARPAEAMSIFEFLRGPASPFSLAGHPLNLDRWSLPILMLGGAIWFAIVQWRRVDWPEATVGAMAVVLALYKVGHSQFHLPLVALVLWLASTGRAGRRLGRMILAYLVFLSIDALAFPLLGAFRGRWLFIRWVIGLPTFLLLAGLLIALIGNRVGATDGRS
jgi:hypothetical protein